MRAVAEACAQKPVLIAPVLHRVALQRRHLHARARNVCLFRQRCTSSISAQFMHCSFLACSRQTGLPLESAACSITCQAGRLCVAHAC